MKWLIEEVIGRIVSFLFLFLGAFISIVSPGFVWSRIVEFVDDLDI